MKHAYFIVQQIFDEKLFQIKTVWWHRGT